MGSVIKDIRTFFNYLVIERNLRITNHFRQFYVPHEQIQILVIDGNQLNYLIHDQEFEQKLRPVMKEVKDIFVIGCNVSLRYSDLIELKRDNLEKINQDYYLKVQSQKTKIYTRIKLPNYAVEIFKRYSKRGKRLLPYFNLVRLNIYLKQLAEFAGWTQEVVKTRKKRGVAEVVYKNKKLRTHYRFCDLISSHTMRRSAITTMLSLQMPEHLVRKISGHAANIKEFHKYVAISQNYLDAETDKVFEKLGNLLQQ